MNIWTVDLVYTKMFTVALMLLNKVLAGPAGPFHTSQEYCHDQTYTASCDLPNHVMLMTAAKAGRLWLGTCVDTDRGHIGCGESVLTQMDSSCSGRGRCEVPVVDVTKHQTRCPKDLGLFLVAQYECVPVPSCDKSMCDNSDFIRPTASSGYLASSLAASTGCGASRCPWMIEVAKGQNINFTLYDFTLASQRSSCTRFGIIYDGHMQRELSNCEDTRKRKHFVYTSLTNVARVELYSMSNEENNFMIRYEVTGCADIETPLNAKVERKEETLSVTCLYSQSAWHLTCNGNAWVGEVGDCPESITEEVHDKGDQSSSFGLLFVIGLGVALGVAIGFTLLCIVGIYMKRKHREQVNKARPLINDNMQYRDYLSKTGTMFGLYPTNQTAQAGADGAIIYRPMHDYTSTLHPQNRPLPHVLEVVTHPGIHQEYQLNPEEINLDDNAHQVCITPGNNVITTPNPTRFNIQNHTTSANGGQKEGRHSGSHPKEHIYELPGIPDRNRAHSADSGLAYSVGTLSDQTNHRTT